MSPSGAAIYIVEDDASFRHSVVRLLRAWGFEPFDFETAGSFLAEPHLRHPACLLLDIHLPDMDGLELQQKIVERGNGLPVVFMTGHGDAQTRVQAMKGGAVDFLCKPFELEDLRRAILKALELDARKATYRPSRRAASRG